MLAQWIVQPKALVPDTLMPAMGVSADQARDMAAYLLALE
jgi:cytochrome c